jgi:ATP-dependent RNA helicase DeaD
MSSPTESPESFESLNIAPELLRAVKETGYETPSPIQAQTIPHLLNGDDVLGQAQTGTGKTAAFALPLLSRIESGTKDPQVLVLAPTRELAIQVSEAFQTYARYMKNFHVLPVYGGQGYDGQLRQLRRGVQVVVGTPGRVMDHIRKGTLKLSSLKALVLDEADEMLRMGFIDDVEWILEQTPSTRQIALFSATMPPAIQKVTKRYLNNPKIVKITSKAATASTVRQRYWRVSGASKIDALTRILEAEHFDAIIIFVRTKNATVELAEKLSARGFSCEALNGDISQNLRERTIDRLKKGKIDILIGTDVVGRGLDVSRISHVINYDIPYDPEAYVHRIGRTGRAGRSGDAILFVAPRESRMLRSIEHATKTQIEQMQLPSVSVINDQRIKRFKERIGETIISKDLELYLRLVTEYQQEHGENPLVIAAALAQMAQGNDDSFLLAERKGRGTKGDAPYGSKSASAGNSKGKSRGSLGNPVPLIKFPDVPMIRYSVEVGREHGVKPGNLVGAIANEADIDSCYIGQIELHEDFSTIDLPEGMPPEVLQLLRDIEVCGQQLGLTASGSGEQTAARETLRVGKKKSAKKPAGKAKKRKSNAPSARKSRVKKD